MEVQLTELIEQIKKDGVEAAEAEAKAITDAAKAEAEAIIAEAQAKAEAIVAGAKAENDRIVKSAEEAIRQAGRNLLISFRESVARELKAVVGETVSAAYQKEALVGLILNAVESWAKQPDADDLSVMMSQKDLDEMRELLLAGLKARMLEGVTLKANDHFDGGFRIAVKDGAVCYDYSAEAVVDMLSNYLSPAITSLLKKAE